MFTHDDDDDLGKNVSQNKITKKDWVIVWSLENMHVNFHFF